MQGSLVAVIDNVRLRIVLVKSMMHERTALANVFHTVVAPATPFHILVGDYVVSARAHRVIFMDAVQERMLQRIRSTLCGDDDGLFYVVVETDAHNIILDTCRWRHEQIAFDEVRVE
jgi:hypothetical protein